METKSNNDYVPFFELPLEGHFLRPVNDHPTPAIGIPVGNRCQLSPLRLLDDQRKIPALAYASASRRYGDCAGSGRSL